MRSLRLDELPALVGTELAVSDWLVIEQDRIDRFADATGDHQWIHVDPVRAATGPFGTTIAHGFLTLSLLPALYASALHIDSRMGVNYGLDSVRFPHPVPAGSRVRARVTLKSLKAVPGLDGQQPGVQMVTTAVVEAEGIDKPVCVADFVTRRYG